MSAPSPWSRKNLLAIAAIIAVAILVIGVTAFATSSGSSDTDSAAAQETHPDFEEMLLDENEMSAVMENRDMTMITEFNGLNPPYAELIDPVECNPVASIADSTEYSEAPWRFARSKAFEENGGDQHWVGEGAVQFDSPESAQAFFDEYKADWDSCDGNTFQFAGDETTYEMTDYSAAADTLLTSYVEAGVASDWSCQRAIGLASAFIAEAQVCGTALGAGRAEQVVTDILAGAQA